MSENRVSIQFSTEQIARIQSAINVIDTEIKTVCQTLTPEQRQQIHKMGPGSVPFVSAVNMHIKQNPQFVPLFVDAVELDKDVITVNELSKIDNLLAPLVQLVEDTTMLAGSEAIVASFSVYGLVKNAAKSNIPGAEVIYNSLKDLLPQVGRKKGTVTPDSPSTAS